MNVIVCDDTDFYVSVLKDHIKHWSVSRQHQNATITHCFSSSEDLLYAWQSGLTIDVLFLDIQIPGEMSGMDLAKAIREKDDRVIIIFVTNYSEYACEGYCVNALRYIQKPVNEKAVFECLDIAYRQWQFSQSQSLVIHLKKRVLVLPYRDILFVEAYAHYLTINLVNGSPVQIRSRIADLYNSLPSQLFAQCHRGFIINLSYVRSMTKNSVLLAGNNIVPMGAKYIDETFKSLKRYCQGV